MRVVVAAAGSRGDAVPFGALAARLGAQGHDAVLVTHEGLIDSLPPDIATVGVPSDPVALLNGPAARAVRRADLRALNRTRELFADFLAAFARPAADALSGADLLVASTFAVAAVDEALRRGVPVVRAHLWPENPGLAGPMPLLPYSWRLPAPVRRTLRRGLRALEPDLAGFDGWWERGRLRVRPHHPAGFTTTTLGTLHAVSSHVLAPGDAEGDVTGWWWPPDDGQVEPGLAARLATRGDPWVFVGFGSMGQSRPGRLRALVEAAAHRAGVRVVLQLPGAEGIDHERVLGIGEVPHHALFPLVAAAVHHGGSGTTGAAVRAGVPSVVVPHFADQFFWAHRLHDLGVAPRPLPRAVLTPDRLARSLRAALAPDIGNRSAELGALVRAEDGTGLAARHLAALVSRTHR